MSTGRNRIPFKEGTNKKGEEAEATMEGREREKLTGHCHRSIYLSSGRPSF